MLDETEILAAQDARDITLSPFSIRQLRGPSYVLLLGSRFRRWRQGVGPIDVWSAHAAEPVLEEPFDGDTVVIEPGEFVLGATLETVRLTQGFAAMISPLSHLARFGLGVTGGADFVNPGFGCQSPSALTLELYNHNRNPLALRAGMPVARLRFMRLDQGSGRSGLPRSIYEGADAVTAPRLYEEWIGRLERPPA